MTEAEFQMFQQYRERSKALEKECKEKDIPFESVKHYWYKSENFSLFVKQQDLGIEHITEKLIEDIKKYAPIYKEIQRINSDEPHALVIDPADVHIGKLCSSLETGDSYNVEIAVSRVKVGVNGILQKSAPYNVDKIYLIIGNDILHTDNAKRTTTSGTPQDTDGMWYENFLSAKTLYVELIESLMAIADVEVVYNPSNHDYTNGFFLAQTLEAWFNRCENVKFNVSIAHRKYVVYGMNLIGTTHGDGAKESNLPLLMANEASKYWHECKYKYWYTHHVHHKTAKDYMNVCVESLRSPSGTDSWHSKHGFQHAPKAIEGYLHHKEYGQVARLTYLF